MGLRPRHFVAVVVAMAKQPGGGELLLGWGVEGRVSSSMHGCLSKEN
jgi:hypothetical protein